MSSVTPSDNAAATYIKPLSDYEDELKRDYSRVKQNAQQQVDDLSSKYEENSRKIGERADQAVETIRDDTRKDYERSRESDRAELEALKAQNYDRFGRDRSNEADVYKQKLAEYAEGTEVERATSQRRLQEADDREKASNEAIARMYADRMDRALQSQRESTQDELAHASGERKTALDEQREHDRDVYNSLSRTRMEEQDASRRNIDRLLADTKRDIDNSEYHSNKATEERLAKDHDANLKRIEDNSVLNHASNLEQTRNLRDKIQDLETAENNYVKEKGQGKTDALREYEDDWRGQARRVEEAHQREISKLHSELDETDAYHAHIADRNLHDRDAYFTKLMAQKAAEGREAYSNLSDQFDRAYNELEKQGRKERDYSQGQLENRAQADAQERHDALFQQAQQYQQSIATQSQLDTDTIQSLQREIQKKNTVSDDTEISPAVENKVRRAIVQQYEKNLAAEVERNRRQTDSLQRNYAERLQNAGAGHESDLAARDSQHETERQQERTIFFDHVQDTEAEKIESLRRADEEHERESTTLSRNFAQESQRQRYDYEATIQTMHDDAATRINAVRQDAEFSLKALQRASSARQNEIIRDYEKKLADQKSDFEVRIDNMKTDVQAQVRDALRQGKTNYEEQARGYEQRIAQLESQFQERERSITQNFEDQLDKVKRSNAALQQKKS